jgi:hypothetical protein
MIDCGATYELPESCANICLATLLWNGVGKWLEGVGCFRPGFLFSLFACIAVPFSIKIYFISTIFLLDKTE